MNGSIEFEHETDNELFEVNIKYHYVHYLPATWNDPAEGGGCEDMVFTVTGYVKYENGNVVEDLTNLTPEQEKELTARFTEMVESNFRLSNRIYDACCRDAETPKWDDD